MESLVGLIRLIMVWGAPLLSGVSRGDDNTLLKKQRIIGSISSMIQHENECSVKFYLPVTNKFSQFVSAFVTCGLYSCV